MTLFYSLIRGEGVQTQTIADKNHVTTRTASRDLETLRCILANDRDFFGNMDLFYDRGRKIYYLSDEEMLKAEELFAIIEILVGSRGLEKSELLSIIHKLKKQVLFHDRKLLSSLIQNKMLEYKEIGHLNKDVIGNLWKLNRIIEEHKSITIRYYKMSGEKVKRHITPLAILFSEYYFYVIAHDNTSDTTKYFRIDRISDMTVHRESKAAAPPVNAGQLKNELQYMWPGDKMRIRFEFCGPSVQSVLDRLPTARILEKNGSSYLIEATVTGDGIMFYLLSQGHWIKVLEPVQLVEKIRQELAEMNALYQNTN